MLKTAKPRKIVQLSRPQEGKKGLSVFVLFVSSFLFLIWFVCFLVGFRLCCAVVIGDVFLFVLLASCYGHLSY